MIAIVGHGPSILQGRGAVIDLHTVVRLKGHSGDPVDWGSRTDYVFARSLVYLRNVNPYKAWVYNDEFEKYWLSFKPKYHKPSTGLCAVFAVVSRFSPNEISLIGFDRLLRPMDETPRYDKGGGGWVHDEQAEHKALIGLGVEINDLGGPLGDISGLRPGAWGRAVAGHFGRETSDSYPPGRGTDS